MASCDCAASRPLWWMVPKMFSWKCVADVRQLRVPLMRRFAMRPRALMVSQQNVDDFADGSEL